MSSLGHDSGGWRKRLTAMYKMGHPTHLTVKVLYYWGHFLVSIYMGYKHFSIPYPFGEVHQHTSSPNIFCHQISDNIPSKFLIIQPDWLQPMNQYSYTSGHFSFQERCTAKCTIQCSSLHEEFPFSTVIQGSSGKELAGCGCALVGGVCILCGTIL